MRSRSQVIWAMILLAAFLIGYAVVAILKESRADAIRKAGPPNIEAVK